jgi:anti-anti-sigma regulatory factor
MRARGSRARERALRQELEAPRETGSIRRLQGDRERQMVSEHVRSLRRRERRALKRAHKLARRRRLRLQREQAAYGQAPYRLMPDSAGGAARCITPPKHLNLRANYDDTIGFLEHTRKMAGLTQGRFWVDFTQIESITAAGALLLVAEFDRWSEKTAQGRLRALDLQAWQPAVRRRLKEMGFFTVLNTPYDEIDPDDPEGERFLAFISGHRTEGAKAKDLRQAIEGLGAKLRDAKALYDGLVEAMTNAQQHAYEEHAAAETKRWWMSASVNAASNKLTVMFVDHGLTIPRTLPKSDLWEIIRGGLSGMDVLRAFLKDHAKMIEAAISVDRSRMKQSHRGNGLKRDIQGYIEQHDAKGSLRIISGTGLYVYKKEPGTKSKVELSKLSSPFRGTFIEWVVENYAESDGNDQDD